MKRLLWRTSSLGQAHPSGRLGNTGPGSPARRPRRPVWPVALAILAIGTTLVGAADSSAAKHRSAHTARTLTGTATAHLHLVKANGSQLDEEGPVTGALSGTMNAALTTGVVFVGSFTIHTNGGTIDGHGKATVHGYGRYQKFSGSMIVTGGNGRYSHAHGRTGLSGTFDRRTYAIVMQTSGRLSY
jgi:hypothetical protein